MAKAAVTARKPGKNGSRAAKSPASKAIAARAAVTAKTKLVPLHDRLVIRPTQQEEVLASGIVIPDTAKEKPQRGEVIAAGSGKVKDDGTRVPLDVKPGDHILFGKYTSQEVKLDGEDYLIMREDEVLAVLEGVGHDAQK